MARLSEFPCRSAAADAADAAGFSICDTYARAGGYPEYVRHPRHPRQQMVRQGRWMRFAGPGPDPPPKADDEQVALRHSGAGKSMRLPCFAPTSAKRGCIRRSPTRRQGYSAREEKEREQNAEY